MSLEFSYIITNIAGAGIEQEAFNKPLEGCNCVGECSSAGGCSCLPFGRNYDEKCRLVLLEDKLNDSCSIIECSGLCNCDKTCNNRLAQFGIGAPLEVFFTSNGKGYGVKTLSHLIKGQFVCEYAGEVISPKIAEQFLTTLDENGISANYIISLRENLHNGDRIITHIDATQKSNLARFINHSCQPNLCVIPVRFGTISPHLGLFCLRDINAGEELCYSYGSENAEMSTKICLCNSSNCRKFMPRVKTNLF